MQTPSDPKKANNLQPQQRFPFSREKIKCPGLTAGAKEVNRLLEQMPKRWAVYAYKHSRELLWVVFVGGTGTGKSTIYNALCEKPLSETGVERPKTFGPIVYAHRNAPVAADFPFDSMTVTSRSPEDELLSPQAGTAGDLVILQHAREDLAHIALVDTPDLDSLEVRNREIVEDLYLLSDAVVFVTSQEKYADEVPFQFLKRIHQDGKICFLLLNKAEDVLTSREVAVSFREQGVDFAQSRFWVLPYVPLRPSEQLRENQHFKDFVTAFFTEVGGNRAPVVLQNERIRRIKKLKEQTRLLVDLLGKERQAAKGWTAQLETLFQAVCRDLLEQQAKHFDEESRDYLQEEIRRLFSKYDVLGKPRRFISQLVLSPLRLLGLWSQRRQESHSDALLRIRERIDLTPIQAAVEKLNRAVLENLSPADEQSPLYHLLRNPEMKVSDEEIKAKVWEEQDKLAVWLESTFRQMAQGIPKGKEWGIYSTSILWGALIVSFEAAIGGGITLLEAALDSALAPFVTKGAVELFAYQELQKIARELAIRYQDGVLSVVRLQEDRYKQGLQSLLTSQQAMDDLDALQRSLAKV